jgi:hypothetical protein
MAAELKQEAESPAKVPPGAMDLPQQTLHEKVVAKYMMKVEEWGRNECIDLCSV